MRMGGLPHVMSNTGQARRVRCCKLVLSREGAGREIADITVENSGWEGNTPAAQIRVASVIALLSRSWLRVEYFLVLGMPSTPLSAEEDLRRFHRQSGAHAKGGGFMRRGLLSTTRFG